MALADVSIAEYSNSLSFEAALRMWMVYSAIFMATNTLFFIILSIRLYKEIKEQMFDVIRVVQLAVLLIYYISESIFFLFCLINSGCGLRPLAFVYSEFILLYFVLDRLWWFMMYLHIKMLNGMSESKDYSDIRAKIKKYEKIASAIVIFIFAWYQIFSLYVKLSQYGPHENDVNTTLTLIYKILCVGFSILILIWTIILYLWLRISMKKNLHFHYLKHIRTLTLITILNVFYLSVFITIKILKKYGLFIAVFDPQTDQRNIVTWTYSFVILFFLNFALYLTIFLNVNVIDFKKYLADVYRGYSISHKFVGASSIIHKSWLARKQPIGHTHTSLELEDENSKTIGVIIDDLVGDTSSEDTLTNTTKRNQFMENYQLL